LSEEFCGLFHRFRLVPETFLQFVIEELLMMEVSLKTAPFTYPHRKKSHRVKSGLLGGHSTAFPREIIRCPKTSCNLALTMIRRWRERRPVETEGIEIDYRDKQVPTKE